MENKLTPEQISGVKAQGFLRNRGTDCFSGRVVVPGGVYRAAELVRIAECAEKFGNGKIVMTSRLSAEIAGIPFEKIPDAQAFLAQDASGLSFGGTGPKIRPIAACKGTTCVFGQGDTQTLAAELHSRYYLGWGEIRLPHKFKISVGGCPNSCMKPSLNDLGIECMRQKGEPMYKLFVGGTFGRHIRVADLLSRPVSAAELFPVIDGVLAWYQKNGEAGERFAKTIERLGLSALESALAL